MQKKTKILVYGSLSVLVLVGAVALSPAVWLGVVVQRTNAGLARAQWPGAEPGLYGRVLEIRNDESEQAREIAEWRVWDKPGLLRGAFVRAQGQQIRLIFDEPFRFVVGDQTAFVVRDASFEETGRAWTDLFSPPVLPSAFYRWAAAFVLRPRWAGWEQTETGRYLRVRIQGGHILGTPGGRFAGGRWEGRIGRKRWRVEMSSVQVSDADREEWTKRPSEGVETDVCEREMDRSMASVFRILALQTQPIPIEADGEYTEGEGRLEIRNGTRVLRISGAPYEMGRQQGVLLRDSVHRGVDRVVYGVGLMYSVTRGAWFFDAAREVIERQAPYVEPRFFEEMRGLAEGAGVALEEIQIANFFPELWHCSGAALFGAATVDGKMLHARVLDYITIAGLQDEAVLIAARPDGYAAFVNIGYSGFVGSVTGMNEHGVAIGEMGGDGRADWDGTPMSLLIRGALEECETLEETIAYFRDRPRTCEYYYVFSEAATRSAVAVKATSDRMDVVYPGEAHPDLPDPVPDTVLLSARSRYRHLVRLVREQYGSIDVERLIDILRRPVSMDSNLHNVIFEVDDRRVHVAHAARRAPACDQPYLRYTWEELFPERP